MKCKSVACFWSGSPPVHRVTAVAALHEPPTLYTGGFDGSIIWWNFIASPEKTEMKPVAMLCGHTAPIADLGICFPFDGPESENLSDASDLPAKAINFGALISACTDGVLCVWSRASGHCRRRRKIPPWAGSPCILRPLPKNRRYVCISCCFPNQENQILNSVEGDESSGDGDLQNNNHLKFTVLIMDTYTLTVVQTVFHGNVSMGPLKSMAVVFSLEDMEKQLVTIIDSYGKLLYIPILKDPVQKGTNVPNVPKDSPISEVMDDSEKKGGLLVAFAARGHVLALVHRTHCIFRQADSGTVFGNISFLDCKLCSEDLIYVVGGMFLGDDTETSDSGFVEEFVAWNNIGAAVMYRIFYLSNKFKFELLHTIPAVLHPNMRISFFFEPLKNYVIRVESNCSHYKEHMFWRPHVTIWHLDQKKDCQAKVSLESEMLGEGDLFDSWDPNFSLPATDGLNHDACREGKSDGDEMTSLQHNALSPYEANGKSSSDHSFDSCREEQLVSCSMVISETYLAPYAIVYGFFNGDIEIVRFHMFFTALDSFSQSPIQEAGSHGQKHHLSGHRGEVICLASHQMVNQSAGCSLNHILMSGSVDCTVRIWDLDSGDPIAVLHQHVAPVRQIIPPPLQSECPWNDCFLSVGDDSCVALVSLQTLRVERFFPGHLHFPAKVVWNGVRGYIACLCQNNLEKSDNILYIWDVKTGGCERILRGAAARSMFDHFLIVSNEGFSSGNCAYGNTSASSLVFPVIEVKQFPQSHPKSFGKGISMQPLSVGDIHEPTDASITSNDMQKTVGNSSSFASVIFQHDTHPIKTSCPFPGVSTLCFDLTSLMSLCSNHEFSSGGSSVGEKAHAKGAGTWSPEKDAYQKENTPSKELGVESPSHHVDGRTDSISSVVTLEHHEWVHTLERCLLQFSLSFLHLWNVDSELDNLLIAEMRLKRPDSFTVASGLLGDRGSMTLTFPGSSSTLELWRSSSEYSALRSLTMVSLAQHLISLSHSYTSASSALAAFYMRKFAEKFSDIKPPLLLLLVSFWQHEFEHVKMASRSLFHCAASRAIPLSLCCSKNDEKHTMFRIGVPVKELESLALVTVVSDERLETQNDNEGKESEITSWLDSYQVQDWISCVGGTTQDAMTAQIIVAAALAVWYPFLVNSRLATVVVHSLVKLVMAMNEKYSAAAAEILAEGMESTWKPCIGSDITRLIGEIFFQVECVSGTSANLSAQSTAGGVDIRETLVGILLPSLAMADIPGFLHVIESQIWSTASDSPVHVVSLVTLMRVVRGSPRNLAPYLDKVVSFILLTMDPGNSTMRKNCLKNSMSALKDVLRVFPMISLNDASTRLAVGDAIGEINNASIRVYDMQSMSKIKVLDVSGPPGLSGLLGGASEMAINSSISALSFSPDGEGLAAFSENGLIIRWWSLGSVWWEKLNRNFVPVLCTKLIFIPPWEGFLPNSTRSSFLSSVLCDVGETNSPGSNKSSSEVDRLKLLIQNLDLSYRLEWVGERKVKLTQHSHVLGMFQL